MVYNDHSGVALSRLMLLLRTVVNSRHSSLFYKRRTVMGHTSQTRGIRVLTAAASLAAAGMMWASGAAFGQQTPPQVLESWENTNDGWTANGQVNPTTMVPYFDQMGFSTTTGVTNGSYSWIIGATPSNTSQGPTFGAMISSPASTAFTTDLANLGTNTINLDVYTPPGSFGSFLQIQLDYNNIDTGYTAASSYIGTAIGSERTISFTLTAAQQSALAASTNPTSLTLQIGGGYTSGNETFYLDNLVVAAPPVVFSTQTASWVQNGSSNWATPTSWSSNPNVPGAVGSRVTFGALSGSPIAANPVVTLNQAANVLLATFQSPDGAANHGYTIAGNASGSLTVTGQLEADSGTHAINVPLTFSTVVNLYVQPGASLSAPVVSNANVFDTFALTAADGSSLGGTFSEGGMQYCSLDINGTWNILSSMSTSQASPVEFFGTTVEANALFNVGNFTINTNSVSGAGTVNIGAGGTFTVGYFEESSQFSGSFTGAGALTFTGLVHNSGQLPSTHFLYGSSPTFTGAVTINGGDTVAMQGPLGENNTLTLDNGILQGNGSFSNPTQTLLITDNGGTVDTAGPGVGAGGCQVQLGAVSAATGAVNPLLSKINGGELIVKSIRNVGLSIGANGGIVQIAHSGSKSAGLSILNSLTLAASPNLSLDLTNNDMIVHSGSLSTIVTELKAGLNRGAGYWNGGGGIVSSAAAADTRFLTTLGYNVGGAAFNPAAGSPFDGVNTTSTDVLVRYTYYGDADLNGLVNGADYALIDTSFGIESSSHVAVTGWSHGDFNYDGVVDGTDYSLIDNTRNQLTASGLSSTPLALFGSLASTSAVPEPTTLGLLGIGAMGLLGRRRRMV
jgi:hypothetical protein